MAEQLTNLSESQIQKLQVFSENTKDTQSILRTLADKDNMEVATQSSIFCGLRQSFNSIEGITADFSVKRISYPEDGTLKVNISCSTLSKLGFKDSILDTSIIIGGEVKRTATTKYTSVAEYCNACLVQEAYYVQEFENSFGLKYDVILAINDNFMAILYKRKNMAAFNELGDILEAWDMSPCTIWSKHKHDPRLLECCNSFLWEPIIYFDSDFKFINVVSKMIHDISILNQWK